MGTKCQFVFLNSWINCPDHTRARNEMIQNMINEKKALFMFETRDYTEFQRAVSKQKSHELWRDRVHIVKENCCKIHFPDCQE